jgi:hypothetical protein
LQAPRRRPVPDASSDSWLSRAPISSEPLPVEGAVIGPGTRRQHRRRRRRREPTAAEPLPVQTYLVTTPLVGFDAALVSLTIRFGQALHNVLPEHLAAVVAEELEGWERISISSGDALLDLLATTSDGIDQALREAIVTALDDGAAALRFSSPTPFRTFDLKSLASGVAAFAELARSPRKVIVGVAVAASCIIVLQVAWGVGSGLKAVSNYAVTQWGKAVVDKVTLLSR